MAKGEGLCFFQLPHTGFGFEPERVVDEVSAFLLCKSEKLLEAVGDVSIIVVQMSNEFATGKFQASIQRICSGDHPALGFFRRVWSILLQIFKIEPRVLGRLCRLDSSIGGTIANDDQFKVGIRLRKDRRNAAFHEQLRAAIGGNADADKRIARNGVFGFPVFEGADLLWCNLASRSARVAKVAEFSREKDEAWNAGKVQSRLVVSL